MTTLTLTSGQISPIIEIGKGTRVTSSGNGTIEYYPGALADAKNGGTFQTWPNGSSAGSVDAIRGMCIRATATGSMTVTLEEGKNDLAADGAYWEAGYVSLDTDANNNTVLVGADGGINTIGIRTSPLKVAVFGDSTANWGTPVSPDNQDSTVVTAPFPASASTTLSYPAVDKCALTYLYPPASLVGNFGVTGNTTTQMLARDQAAAGITRRAITDMINLAPDVAIFRAGSINDLLALTSASTQADVDAVYTRHIELLDRAASGITKIIDEGFFGYSPDSGTAADIAFRKAAIVSLNARYKAYAAASNGRITFLDLAGVITAADGAYVSGVYESTGVHLNQLGAWLLGKEERAALSRMFGVPGTVRFPGINVFSNPMFATVTAQAYGTAATGVSYTAASSTRQNATIETIDGMRFATVEHVMTGADPYGTLDVAIPLTTMGIVANDVWGFECDFLVSTLDGSPLPAASTRLAGQVALAKTAAGSLIVNLLSAAYTRPTMTESQMIMHLSAPIKIQEASAALTDTGSYLRIQFGTALNGTYKIGIANPRFVKLGVTQATM